MCSGCASVVRLISKLDRQDRAAENKQHKIERKEVRETFLAERPSALRVLRTIRGLSQVELANELNCTHCTVSAWELGKAQPTIQYIGLLARVLGVSASDVAESFKPDVIIGIGGLS